MAKHLVPQYASSYSGAAASTAYASPANLFLANTTESNKRITHRGADVTISKWRILFTVNARTTTSTFTWFKNGSATSLAISVAGGVTGAVEDTTNSVSLTAGDTHSVRGVWAAEASALSLIGFGQYMAETTSAASPLAMATSTQGTAQGASVTSYHRFFQFSASGATNNDRPDHEWAVAGAFSGLFGYVAANSRSDATTFAIYNNGASVNSVSVAAGVTGRFENTANSASIAVGDDVQLRVITGGGTGTITPNEFGSHFTPTTAGESPTITGANSTSGLSSGAVFYHAAAVQGTEANTNWIARFDGVASRLSIRATVNTCTTATTAVSRKNGANGNQSVSLAAGVTGVAVDTTNTDSLTTGDLFCARLTYGTMPDTVSRFAAEIGRFAESTGITGTGAVTLPALTASGSAAYVPPPITGTGAVTIPALQASGAGVHTVPVFTGDGGATLPALAAGGAAVYVPPPIAGDGALTIPALQSGGAGTFIAPGAIIGDGAVTLPALQADGSGVLSIPDTTGDGSVTIPALSGAGTGIFVPAVEVVSSDPWTAAWAEAQASAPSNVVELYTLELLHPSFGSERFRMVNDTQDHSFVLEADAPLDASTVVTFTAVPFEMPWPEQEEGRVPELTIRIDNIGREVMPYMDAAVTTFAAIDVILRVYLWNADTETAQAGIDPIRFPLRSVTITETYVEGTASPADLANLRAMRLVYDLTNYPGMSQ